MKPGIHVLFWIVVVILLTAVFTPYYSSIQESFYFVSMLLPVVVSTCYFFNFYLVPYYLFTKRYGLFALYFIYMLVVSVYLEMIVIVLAFVLLAEYSYENMSPVSRDIFILAIALYFIVFLFSFILLIRQSFAKQSRLEQLEREKQKNGVESLNVKVNRRNKQIILTNILYIESLSDYVQIHLETGETVTTREKISALVEKLPDHFIRIHRSFLVNKNMIDTYSKEEVIVKGQELPISRSYKQNALEELKRVIVPA